MLWSCSGQPLSTWINISIYWCEILLLQCAKNINNHVLRVGNGICCSLGWGDVARAKAYGDTWSHPLSLCKLRNYLGVQGQMGQGLEQPHPGEGVPR